MAKVEFKSKVEELIKLMVDTIADKEYAKLVSSIPPKLSWASYINAEQTLENACLGFGKWLVEQLAMWEEHCGKKFVVDHFEKSCMEDIGEEELEEEFEIYKNENFVWRIFTKKDLKLIREIWCLTIQRALENNWIFGLR